MTKVQGIVLACSSCMRPLGVYWEDTRHMYNSIIVCITRQSRDTVEQQIGRGHVLELRYCRSKRD